MKRLFLGVVAAVVLAACAAHEKNGDRAAAVGDWKNAWASYRAALASEPDNAELKAKYDQARTEALADTQKRAQACAQTGDWGCALAESDFALQVDPGNAEISTFRARAATQVALGKLDFATQQVQRGQFAEAREQMDQATQLSPEPEVRTRAEGVRRLIVTNGRAAAEAYRNERNLIAAHELAQLVASLDASQAGWAQGIATEYEQWVTYEYERLAREGDEARVHHDWAMAQDRYQAALKLRQGGRAAPLEEYVRQVANAEGRLAEQNWGAASEHYRNALRTGQDDGYAASQLERVEPRPYRVSLRSVMVVPTRPNGQAWVGVASPMYTRLARMVTDMASRRGLTDALVQMAMTVPAENRPSLRVEVTLPDGLRLSTGPSSGIFTRFDSDFVTMTNAFDERRVAFQVFMYGPGGPELVGGADVPLRELAARRDLTLEGRSILGLRLATGPAQGRNPGSFVGMAPVMPGVPGAPAHAASPIP